MIIETKDQTALKINVSGKLFKSSLSQLLINIPKTNLVCSEVNLSLLFLSKSTSKVIRGKSIAKFFQTKPNSSNTYQKQTLKVHMCNRFLK